MIKVVLPVLLVVACACTSTQNTSKVSVQEAGQPIPQVQCQKGALVLIPEPGPPHGHRASTPTEKVAKRLEKELKRFCADVRTERLSLEEGLHHARGLGFEVVVMPQVVAWEKRATQWSGIPAVMELRVTVYDSSSGAVLDAQDVRSESGGMIWSAMSPDVLLKEAAPVWARTVFHIM